MKKIVMVRRTGLGDFIAGMVPVCNLLKKKYGNVEFHLFMSKRNAELVKYFFPEDVYIYIWTSGNKYIQAINLGLKYRKINPDIGLSPIPDWPKLNNLFLFLIGAKERYARVNQKLLSRIFINHPLKMDDDMIHSYHVGLGSLKVYDSSINNIEQELLPRFNKSLIPDFNTELTGPFIMVEVSNNRITSQLSNEKMARILNDLINIKKFAVFITAKTEDKKKAENLKSMLNMESEIYINPDIHKFISFVNKADIVLAGDGGLGHIAGALNKKIVAVYGQTSIERWGILGGKVEHLYDPVDVNNIDDTIIKKALAGFL